MASPWLLPCLADSSSTFAALASPHFMSLPRTASSMVVSRDMLFKERLLPSQLVQFQKQFAGFMHARHGQGVRHGVSQLKPDATVVQESEEIVRSDVVSAVLFDMDGVLCDSEERSRRAAVDLFAEMGVQVSTSDFIPFMGTGEANFLGGVAHAYGLTDFDSKLAKKRFFQIYLDKYARPNSGLAYHGALELIVQCKKSGLKVAVASSADWIKVVANLQAASLPESYFDAIVSADEFQNLKPAPDIFLSAAKALDVPVNECVVIEDALAGLQAADAAGMRCIAVTTTLSEEKLVLGKPSLIKKDIGDISLDDIRNLQKTTGEY
eukprot:c24557_g1_i1 orf=579-1547(-)